jgi:hypothetical protein
MPLDVVQRLQLNVLLLLAQRYPRRHRHVRVNVISCGTELNGFVSLGHVPLTVFVKLQVMTEAMFVMLQVVHA